MITFSKREADYWQSGHQLATVMYACFYITVVNWRMTSIQIASLVLNVCFIDHRQLLLLSLSLSVKPSTTFKSETHFSNIVLENDEK